MMSLTRAFPDHKNYHFTIFVQKKRPNGKKLKNPVTGADGSRSSSKKSKSHPPVQAACDKRPTLSVIGSVIDVCLVTLITVVPAIVMDAMVARWTSGCGCGSGSPVLLWDEIEIGTGVD